MLKADAVRHALTRGSRERTALGVNRELPFARLVDGRVQRGSIDRIVIDRIGGRIRSASIIDFKTDQVSASDAPLAASSYRSQLQTYRQAVAEMMAIDEKTSSIGVLFVEPGMLINL
jgi:ATP-dependent exoDNAse (exonuclease V) beta subunit